MALGKRRNSRDMYTMMENTMAFRKRFHHTHAGIAQMQSLDLNPHSSPLTNYAPSHLSPTSDLPPSSSQHLN